MQTGDWVLAVVAPYVYCQSLLLWCLTWAAFWTVVRVALLCLFAALWPSVKKPEEEDNQFVADRAEETEQESWSWGKKTQNGFRLWCCSHLPHLGLHDSQCGTVDAEIEVPSVEDPEVTSVLPLKPGEGQNIARHASPTARSSFLVLISSFPVHSPSFFPNPLPMF